MSMISSTFQPLIAHELLHDGTAVTIRRILPDDTARIRAFYKRLSFESIYLRFQTYRDTLPNEEIVHLCTVDYTDRMAFVATIVDGDGEHIIGVVRYDRLGSDHPNCARFAIAVEDAYQRRGLGLLLLQRLVSYARFHNIRKFVAMFLLENTGFLKLLKHSGLPLNLLSFELGKLEACIHLDVDPCL